MRRIFIICISTLLALNTNAQVFIDKGEIVYEVRTNLKKTLGSSVWAENMKANLPQFLTSYFTLSFTNNTGLYQFTKHEENNKVPQYLKEGNESSKWYTDLNNRTQHQQKNMFGTKLDIVDSLVNIKWRYTDEIREIAGFHCRKAVGVIMDSVYVFAFYTDEILYSGGPCSINGLPGTILGMTIPRLYTSWVATSVSVNNAVTVTPLKQGKKPFKQSEFAKFLDERMNDWIDENDEDDHSWLNLTKWNARL